MNSAKVKSHDFDFTKALRNYSHSAALTTAIELDIFESLKDDFLSLEEIKEKCGLRITNRNLSDFLDILYINKHLIREGKLESAKYKTSNDIFLKENPNNLIPLIQMTKLINKRYEILPETMRNGRFAESQELIDNVYSDANNTKSYLLVMSNMQIEIFKSISKSFYFKSYKTCLDVGGCLGAFSIEMRRANPHLIVYTFDLPIIEKFVFEFLIEHKMIDYVNVISGDFFIDEFPVCDIIMMGNILHGWNLEKKKFLIKKAFMSLGENGVFIVVENFVDNERTDSHALYSSFNLFVECYDGYNFSKEEFENFAKEAGFRYFEYKLGRDGVEVAFLRK